MLHHKGCTHERHQPYLAVFDGAHPEKAYLRKISEFVIDPQLSPKDAEDLELFQDLVFEGPSGRVHIFYYEELFKNFYQSSPSSVLESFSKYLEFLDKISTLFVLDAYYFIFRKEDPSMIEGMLTHLSYDLKMSFIRDALNRPKIIKMSPKLKMLNLFS